MRRHLVSFTSRAPRQSSQFGQMCYRGSGQTEGEGTEGGRDVVPSKHHPACGCSLAYLSLSNRWPCVRQSFMRPPDCSGEMNGSSREISVAKKRQGGCAKLKAGGAHWSRMSELVSRGWSFVRVAQSARSSEVWANRHAVGHSSPSLAQQSVTWKPPPLPVGHGLFGVSTEVP